MIDWSDVERRLAARKTRRWTDPELDAYEARTRIVLPLSLRKLYRHVGEGAGLLPLDVEAEARHYAIGWGHDPDIAVANMGRLDHPFPFSDAWNIEVEDPDDIAPESGTELAHRYWQELDGAFPIADVRDVQDTLVVVTGEAVGTVWCDARIACGGILPWRDRSGRRMTIDTWAELFVDAALTGGSLLASRPDPASMSSRVGSSTRGQPSTR